MLELESLCWVMVFTSKEFSLFAFHLGTIAPFESVPFSSGIPWKWAFSSLFWVKQVRESNLCSRQHHVSNGYKTASETSQQQRARGKRVRQMPKLVTSFSARHITGEGSRGVFTLEIPSTVSVCGWVWGYGTVVGRTIQLLSMRVNNIATYTKREG